MIHDAFNNKNISLQKLLKFSKQAIFIPKEAIDSRSEIRCKVRMILTKPIAISGRSIALRKGSPYREFMDHILLQLHENGAIKLITNRYDFKHDCGHYDHYDNTKLSFKKVALPFTLILIGTCFAIVVCLTEMLIKFIK